MIAAVHALAGNAGTTPAQDIYQHAGNLFDVTSGADGSCSPTYLCTAAAGYDGPTGWGTPNGLTAFTAGSSTGNTVTVTNPGNQTGTVGTAVSLSWTTTPSVIGQWAPSEPAHTGTWDAWLDGYGTTHTDTVSQSVAIPAGCSAAFSFWVHIDTAETTTTTAFDTLQVQVLNSSGTVLSTLATYSNLNHATGYVQHSFSLSSFAGQTVTLKFTGKEDSSLQTSFVLDDTALTAS